MSYNNKVNFSFDTYHIFHKQRDFKTQILQPNILKNIFYKLEDHDTYCLSKGTTSTFHT